MDSANSDREYGSALKYLNGRVERIAVQVFIRPSSKTWFQTFNVLEQRSKRWIWKPKAFVDLDVAKLYIDYKNGGQTHLQQLADVFTGTKPGQRVSFVGILWEEIDSEGNLMDVGRVRGGHEPKMPMPLSETLRISRTLVKMAFQEYKLVETRRQIASA